jgi:membrane protease YdiL (CAAX protease family)
VKGEWLALGFAMVYPTAAAVVYFLALAPSAPDPSVLGMVEPTPASGNAAMQVVYAGGKIIQFAFPVVYLLVTGAMVKPRRPSFAGLGAGLAFGLLTAALILGFYHSPLSAELLPSTTRDMVRGKVEEMLGSATPARYLLLAAFLSLVHSLLEEYYWRWFVFGRLRALVPVWLAGVLSSLAFMAHHVVVLHVYLPGRFWTAVVPCSLGIAVGAGVWAWLFHRTGSIYSPWLSHMIVDMAIMAVGYEMLFG